MVEVFFKIKVPLFFLKVTLDHFLHFSVAHLVFLLVWLILFLNFITAVQKIIINRPETLRLFGRQSQYAGEYFCAKGSKAFITAFRVNLSH